MYQKQRQKLTNAINSCPSLQRGYHPTPWLLFDYFGHVMTVIVHVLQRLHIRLTRKQMAYKRELLTLKDGGTVALDWISPPNTTADPTANPGMTEENPAEEKEEKEGEGEMGGEVIKTNSKGVPVVIIMHGLTGCSQSVYIIPFVRLIRERGWESVVMVARGCGGVRITAPGTFTASRTDDFGEAVEHVRALRPRSAIFGVGFSLGAGLLAKYVGEKGDASGLTGATCVSISWNFLLNTPYFEIWSRNKLVHDLKEYVSRNFDELQQHTPMVDFAKVMSSINVREFDTEAVVPQFGYRDVDHYYTDSSAGRVSNKISTPTVAIIADDDPVCSSEGCPEPHQLGPGLVVVRTSYGGHVAFGQDWYPGRESWAHHVALEWFETLNRQGV